MRSFGESNVEEALIRVQDGQGSICCCVIYAQRPSPQVRLLKDEIGDKSPVKIRGKSRLKSI
jgi:hypothetical protein